MDLKNDNSLFFMTLSLLCVWLIVDYVIGKKYLGAFLSMLPFMNEGESLGETIKENVKEKLVGEIVTDDQGIDRVKGNGSFNGAVAPGQMGSVKNPDGTYSIGINGIPARDVPIIKPV